MITETVTIKKYEYEELTEEAKRHAQETPEAHELMAYDINDEMQNILWTIDEFNKIAPASLFVFDAHGPATETVAANKCDFFEAVEYLGQHIEYGYFAEIAEAYNKHLDKHDEELRKLLENIETAEDESENVPMGQPDYFIYQVMEMQDRFARIFDDALEAAASVANELIEGIREMYSCEYDRGELLRDFYWTEEGEYIGAM